VTPPDEARDLVGAPTAGLEAPVVGGEEDRGERVGVDRAAAREPPRPNPADPSPELGRPVTQVAELSGPAEVADLVHGAEYDDRL
jgi:hypothetical protein